MSRRDFKNSNEKTTGKKSLSGEDVEIWKQVTSSVEQLSPKKSKLARQLKHDNRTKTAIPLSGTKMPTMEELLGEKVFNQPVQMPAKQLNPMMARKSTQNPSSKNSKSFAPLPSYSPQLNMPKKKVPFDDIGERQLDRKTKRALSKGKYEISATLDLHGLTQDQAHKRLIEFVSSNMRQNNRYVLVITGKGLSKAGGGILKKIVPKWLLSTPLSSMVNKFEIASPYHGGSGALYLQLSKPFSD